MRVAYLSHTSLVSGAERYLLALLRGLPDDVSPVVLCPDGPLRDAVAELGVATAPVPPVEPSFRLHPVRSARGLVGIASAGRLVRRLCAQYGVDLLHANSGRAGLVAASIGARSAPPIVVTIHDCLPHNPPGRAIRFALHRRVALALANSRYTARNFGGPRTRVVYPPVELDRQPDPSRVRRLREQLGIGDSSTVLAVVGQITPWKGQAMAIEALSHVREALPDAALVLAGEVKFAGPGRRYDNSGYLDHLRELCERRGLDRAAHFIGEREDVTDVLGAADLLLAPSWEEPFGIAVGEAMLAGTPVIATAVGGPAELIEDGVSGRLIPPRDPRAWARAVVELAERPGARSRMAEAALRRASGLGSRRFVGEILSAYADVHRGPES